MSQVVSLVSSNDPSHAPARVALVCPNPLERAGLRSLLERSGDRVAMELDRLSSATAREFPATPDVVLVDLDGATEASLHECVRRWPGVPAIAILDDFDFARARSLILAGARGVMTRAETADHLVAAVRKVREHELWLDRTSVARLIDELSSQPREPGTAEVDPRIAALTEREREVVELVAKGMCNKSIASRLAISDNTVRHHLTSIFAKLGVHDRLSLAVLAFRHAVV